LGIPLPAYFSREMWKWGAFDEIAEGPSYVLD